MDRSEREPLRIDVLEKDIHVEGMNAGELGGLVRDVRGQRGLLRVDGDA